MLAFERRCRWGFPIISASIYSTTAIVAVAIIIIAGTGVVLASVYATENSVCCAALYEGEGGSREDVVLADC